MGKGKFVNKPCPCGSGKKLKNCCIGTEQPVFDKKVQVEQEIKKVSRSLESLILSLEENLDLLNDAIIQVQNGNKKYLKIIKGTLRVLVYESRTNKPLLINIADKFQITPTVIIETPFGIKQQTLKDFLSEIAFASGTQNFKLTNLDLIVKGSQQEGSAHEDWEIDTDYEFSKGNGLLIGGISPHLRMFVGLAKCIHSSGSRVLSDIHS